MNHMDQPRIPWPGILRFIADAHGDKAAHVLAIRHGGREVYIPRMERPVDDPLAGLAPLAGEPERWIRKQYGGAGLYIPKASYPAACCWFRNGMTVATVASMLHCSYRTASRYRKSASNAGLI